MVSNYLPREYLLLHKENSNFTVEKLREPDFNQGHKVTIIMGQIKIMSHLIRCNKNTVSCDIPTKDILPAYNDEEKHEINPY